ncbi:hypothetical protein [Streptomyces sp. NPDC003077]|uniref:hypothetical protein n=1 Tax=Streptomyces sp. NPDC003077 TaxID=3154443 RepID=UPI0033BA4166
MQTKTINGNRPRGEDDGGTRQGDRPGAGGPDGGGPAGRSPVRDAAPLLAGVAVAVGCVGAVLALADISSPLRAPFTLFFLLLAPAAAIGAALGRLDPLGRAVAAGAGAIAVNLLVAQAMLALHLWSTRGGVVAVTVISGAVLAGVYLRRRGGRSRRPGTE